MSQGFDIDRLDEISAKHVQLNSKYLREFFARIFPERTYKLLTRNPDKLRKFCESVNALKRICKDTTRDRRSKATFQVNQRKTVVNPVAVGDNTETSDTGTLTPEDTPLMSHQKPITETLLVSPKTPFQNKIGELNLVNAPRKPMNPGEAHAMPTKRGTLFDSPNHPDLSRKIKINLEAPQSLTKVKISPIIGPHRPWKQAKVTEMPSDGRVSILQGRYRIFKVQN
jgi:hypothetical protein